MSQYRFELHHIFPRAVYTKPVVQEFDRLFSNLAYSLNLDIMANKRILFSDSATAADVLSQQSLVYENAGVGGNQHKG